MTEIRIALLQMAAPGIDQDATRAKGEEYCRRAAALGADVALFPEMWSNGYTLPDVAQPEEREEWRAQAIASDSAFVTGFASLARELGMAIAITYLQAWDGAPRNAVSLFDRHGRLALTYAKVHTCDFDREAELTPGDEFHVATIDTAQGPLRVGAMICFDREFPESARILMLKGAEVILIPNACEMEANRLGQLRARAWENMVVVALANYAVPQANGHSVAYEGVVFDDKGCSLDPLIVEAGGADGVYMACFDLDRLRSYRQHEVWGNAYRKPQRYGLLTSLAVQPPFVRMGAGGAEYDRTKR